MIRRSRLFFLVLFIFPTLANAQTIVLGEYQGTGQVSYSNLSEGKKLWSNDDCDIAVNLTYKDSILDYSYSYYCALGSIGHAPGNDYSLRFWVDSQNRIFQIKKDGTLSKRQAGEKKGQHFQISLVGKREIKVKQFSPNIRRDFNDHFHRFCPSLRVSKVQLVQKLFLDFTFAKDQLELERKLVAEKLPLFVSTPNCFQDLDLENQVYKTELHHQVTLEK
ncbi:MAG: hypothetical protein AAF203_08195 [Pseudomonadota bacterium]